MWHLSSGVLIQLLKKSIHLTYNYSNYPEQSQLLSLLPPLDRMVVVVYQVMPLVGGPNYSDQV